MIRQIIFLFILALYAPPLLAAVHHFENYSIAVLQGLDKPNARVQRFEVAVGRVSSFGPLDIKVRACRKAPPEETPEAAAFLEIDDTRQKDTEGGQLFRGWMFASSPALSALEHPVYDVWVLDCKNPQARPSSEAPSPASSPVPAKKAASPPAKAAPKSR